MKPVHALLQLQQLDNRADGIRARLRTIQELIEGSEALRAASAACESAREEHGRLRAHLNDLTLQQAQLKIDGDSAEERLYSGDVTNPRELQELQAKLEELRRRHAALDAPIADAGQATEAAAVAETNAEEELALVREAEAARHTELLSEQEALQTELNGMSAALNSFRAAASPAQLTLYDQLRLRAGGQAVAQLVGDDECSVCGFELTAVVAQQVRRGQLVQCTSCQRLMVP